MAEDISIGDKVWLKSGSPSMVVRDIDAEAATAIPTAECEWLVGNAAHRAWFAVTSLTKNTPAP
jgi:uncharacterized protein YodC (DUF2158 family)